MLPKISLKKLMFLSLGLLIIGALTNCGGSSGGGGGSGGAAPAAKKPVEKAPEPEKEDPEKEDPDNGKAPGTEDPPVKAACSDPLDIKVSVNDADAQCLFEDKKTLDFALKSTILDKEEGTRTWKNSNVKVVLSQISEDATANPECASVEDESVDKGWLVDFSKSTSCKITVSLTAEPERQVDYILNLEAYEISEAADFKSTVFANTAARFVLTKNIDLEEEETASFASSFKGILDGSGHTIKGLVIDAPGTDQVGLISQIQLKPDDSTVEIKDLTLGITKLVGQYNVGGLIGRVWSDEGAKAVQIKDVTVEFTNSAKLKCNDRCGGLVGYADSRVHFSGIKVNGAVSISGSRIGGVIGRASAMRLTDVTAHFNMNHSGGANASLVAGWADGNSILSKIDASGVITCAGFCNKIGGVAGRLEASQLSQAKSSLQLTRFSNAEYVGGVVGQSVNGTLTAVYGKLTAEVSNTQYFGTIVGRMEGRSLEKAVGYLNVTASGTLNNSGSLIGGAPTGQLELKQVFAAGSMNAGGISGDVGQMIGRIEGELTADNCYSGAFTGKTIPAAAVGYMSGSDSASFTKCYTRAPNFVKENDLPKVTFNTVYATNAQEGKDKTQVKELPDTFDLSVFNDSDTLWTNEYDGNEYKYPMLAYPKEDMGPVSEADWFKHQIENNPEVQVDSNTGS